MTDLGEATPEATPDQGRLWTPWRMRYVGGGAKAEGCLFCNQLAGADDVASLVLHRGEHVFVVMNLFPYNTGHVMVVPNAHVPSPEDADPATLAELSGLLRPLLAASRRVLNCAGFNVGMNVGATAGAGIGAHLHQHVVPRWVGDANFMPILAGTMVLPELIPVTYAKLRAELSREVGGNPAVIFAMVDRKTERVLVASDGSLPVAVPTNDQPVWQAAVAAASAIVPGHVEIAGWAGGRHSDRGPSALALRVDAEEDASLGSGHRWSPLDDIPAGTMRHVADWAATAAASVATAPG